MSSLLAVPACSEEFFDLVLDGRRQEIALDGRDTLWRLCWYHIDPKYQAIWTRTVHGNLPATITTQCAFSDSKRDGGKSPYSPETTSPAQTPEEWINKAPSVHACMRLGLDLPDLQPFDPV